MIRRRCFLIKDLKIFFIIFGDVDLALGKPVSISSTQWRRQWMWQRSRGEGIWSGGERRGQQPYLANQCRTPRCSGRLDLGGGGGCGREAED
ncbi:hypothetical protein Q3G72_024657 [Acer saccharum]|nr:hypothetical protein Q3G72_024657 [Acer saccharum]